MGEQNFLYGEAILAQFGYHDVKLQLNTPIVEIVDDGVIGSTPDGERLF